MGNERLSDPQTRRLLFAARFLFDSEPAMCQGATGERRGGMATKAGRNRRD